MSTVVDSKLWQYMTYPVFIEYSYIHMYMRLKRH